MGSPRAARAAVPATSFDWRSPFAQLVFLLLLAVALGGGGVGFGLCNLAVQLAAILLLAVNSGAVSAFFRNSPKFLVALVAISLLVPLLQLVPLPPSVWAVLPGRDLVVQAFDVIGRPSAWQAVSVDSNRTFIAFLSMLPMFAVLVLVARLSPVEIDRLLWVVVALGVVCALFGGAQIITGNTIGVFYAEMVQRDDLYGTFASHNATGLFFDIALAALFALPRSRGGHGFTIKLVLGALLVLAVVLTRSRSSMALMLLVLLFGGARQMLRRKYRESLPKFLAITAAILALVSSVGFFALKSQRVQMSLQRFDNLEDVRPHIWSDARSSAQRFWPVGAGMGTFDEVFQVDESLEYLDAKRAGRAHNDYLEIAIEAGGLGIALIVAWLGWAAVAAQRARAGALRWQCFGSALSLALIALQSAIDYPLRNQTTLVIAAVMIGILARAWTQRRALVHEV